MGQLDIITASAGSGKTFRLTLEYIRNLMIAPQSYRNILAVTFTNKATAEMKERILKELCALAFDSDISKNPFYGELKSDSRIDLLKIGENARRALRYILHDYSRFSVSTIDKFFLKIMRSFMRELGMEGSYEITFDNDYLTEMAIDNMIDRAKNEPKLWRLLQEIIDLNVDGGGVGAVKKSLKSIAPKIYSSQFAENRDEQSLEILELLFKEIRSLYKTTMGQLADKGAEVLSFAQTSGLTTDDIPGKTRGFLPNVQKIITTEKYDYNKTTLSTALGEKKWDKKVDVTVQNQMVALLREFIEAIDSSKYFCNSCRAVMKNDLYLLLLSDLSSTLDNISKESGSILMGSSMRLLSTLTAENDAPFIYEKCGNNFNRFMIDEFQDTSTEQWQNFTPLINDTLSSTTPDTVGAIFLGDIKQSIYGWRGGDWRLLAGDVKKDITSQSAINNISLTVNWRSEKNIVNFNNTLIGAYIDSVNSDLNEKLNGSISSDADINNTLPLEFINGNLDLLKRGYCDLVQTPSPVKKEDKGFVDISYYTEKGENLDQMILAIEDAQNRGYSGGDIAILVRTQYEASQIAEKIITYRSENPEKGAKYNYDFVSAEALRLSSSQSVNLVVNCLKIATLKKRDKSVEAYLHNMLEKNEKSSELDSEQLAFFAQLETLSTLEAFELISDHFALSQKDDDVAYIQALHQKIVGFVQKRGGDKHDFVEWWESEGYKSNLYMSQGSDSIFLGTIHSSKGLEFKIVIIPFLLWKIEPKPDSLFWAKSSVEPFNTLGNILLKYEKSLAESYFSQSYFEMMLTTAMESSNILYVALTRSQTELYLMIDQTATSGRCSNKLQEVLNMRASDFLESKSDKSGYTMGSRECAPPRKDAVKPQMYPKSYNSFDYKDRIKIKPSLQRYYEPEIERVLSPRHFGVIMHRLFERASSYSDIVKALDIMEQDMLISSEDKKVTEEALKLSFENETIAEWFDPHWEVKAENDILIPSSMSGGKHLTLRPDRVLIDGNRAVVIDYKFGSKSLKYHKQVADYISILKTMGYSDVKGYIWYILSYEIEEVK